MRKSATFVASLLAYLKDELLETEVDAVVLTPRTLLEALDAGKLKGDNVERVDRGILIRRANEEISENRAGDRRRLTTVGLFDVACLINSNIELDQADRYTDEALALAIMDLTDLVQEKLEDAPRANETGAYNVSIRSLTDVADPTSKFFGSLITIEAHLKQV